VANFFVSKKDTFTVVFPFDCTDPDNPQVVFANKFEEYPLALQAVAEENLEYHFLKFRKPDWGLDCYTRELSYQNASSASYGPAERVFSQEKLNEARLRYLLIGSSFFPTEEPISFTKRDTRDSLSEASEDLIKTLDPTILKMFLSVASQVLDLGIPVKRLLLTEDYQKLRNIPGHEKTLLIEKGLIAKPALADDGSPEAKKKLGMMPKQPSTQPASQEALPGQPST